jgi:hypothetical protein
MQLPASTFCSFCNKNYNNCKVAIKHDTNEVSICTDCIMVCLDTIFNLCDKKIKETSND